MFWNANNQKKDWVSWHPITLYVPKVFSFNMSFAHQHVHIGNKFCIELCTSCIPITFSFVTSFAQSFIEFWVRHTKHSSIQKYEILKKERMWGWSHLFVAIQKVAWSFSLSIPRVETQELELRGLLSLPFTKQISCSLVSQEGLRSFFFHSFLSVETCHLVIEGLRVSFSPSNPSTQF